MIRAFHERQSIGGVETIFDALLSLQSEPMLLVAEDSHRILRANTAAARMLGVPTNELESNSTDALFANDAAAENFVKELQRLPKSDRPQTIHAAIQTATGELVPASLRVVFIPAGPDHLAVFAVVIRPTFGRGQAAALADKKIHPPAAVEHESARAARAALLGEMAASIAHEVNQPLTAMINYASAGLRELRRPAPSTERAAAYMESAATQARRAVELVRKLTDFIRGRKDGRTATSSLNDAVLAAITLIEAEARSHRTTLITDLQDDLPAIQADPVLIQQVVLNLLKNAIEAMRQTPPAQRRLVVITWRTNDEMVAVSVRDRGSGAPPEAATRLFDPFYSTKPHGLGLGLTISRSIVEAHGGELWASSHPDGGMLFTFTLPAVAIRSP